MRAPAPPQSAALIRAPPDTGGRSRLVPIPVPLYSYTAGPLRPPLWLPLVRCCRERRFVRSITANGQVRGLKNDEGVCVCTALSRGRGCLTPPAHHKRISLLQLSSFSDFLNLRTITIRFAVFISAVYSASLSPASRRAPSAPSCPAVPTCGAAAKFQSFSLLVEPRAEAPEDFQ